MSRIPHQIPMNGYDHVAGLLQEAGGKGGRIARDEAENMVADLRQQGRGTEALAAENIFKLIDARDSRPGHQVTAYDLKKDRSFVEQRMLENRDVDRNGYSAADIAEMSPTGRALVELGLQLEIAKLRSRVPHSTPERGLFHVAAMIRQAAKDDLITSKADVEKYADNLYQQGRGAEALAFSLFAGFIDQRDSGRGSRITDSDITRAVDYASAVMLEKKDTNHNGYSQGEIATFSRSAKAFLLIGRMIEAGILKSAMPLEGAEIRKTLSKLVSGQEFDQMGSEGGQGLRAVHRDGNYSGVTVASFRKAFNMPNRDIQVNEKFTSEQLRTFIQDNATVYGRDGAKRDEAKAEAAFASTAILRSLDDLKVLVTGSGDQGLLATYIVGIAPDKSMVGVQTGVVWT